jgi:acyl phosphate:glycerol-3-phosphate acyltransferase
MNALLLILLAYLVGAIPTGYWVVMALKGIDLTAVGSGSTGTTNVLRNAGKGAAAFVFIVDILKGFLPVWLSIYAGQHGWLADVPSHLIPWVSFLVALTTLVGHSKSIFLKFKGGKSAATGLGAMAAMNFLAACGAFSVFLAVLGVGKIVSLSSITAVISAAVIMQFVSGEPAYVAFCALGAAYVVLRHKENIKRLLAGTEPKIGQKLEDAGKKHNCDDDDDEKFDDKKDGAEKRSRLRSNESEVIPTSLGPTNLEDANNG